MGHNRNLADYAHHFDGTNIDLGSGNIETDGVVTYEDVTNVDAIGIVTARAGVKVPDNQKVFLGTGDDLQVYHSGTDSLIVDNSRHLLVRADGTGDLYLQSDNKVILSDIGANETFIECNDDADVKLFYNNIQKLATTTTGATVTGTLVSDGVTSELDLSAISSSISDTAVHVFVYDTRKDSDGGAWRKRTQHTSWYNETLNTSTRGSRKEFPAVAVIVTETRKVTIYDGDDPDLPMWMIFNAGSGKALNYPNNSNATSTVMLNGKLANAASGGSPRFRTIDFLSDSHLEYSHTDGRTTFNINISQRNAGLATFNYGNVPGSGIIHRDCNDVAMTVLPNAPIDSATGLPVPTIAVATVAGVSIIKDDGSVRNDNSSGGVTAGVATVEFVNDTLYYGRGGAGGNLYVKNSIGSISANFSASHWYRYQAGGYGEVSGVYLKTNDDITVTKNKNDVALFGDTGLVLLEDKTTSSLVDYITTSYNTGWMHGNIKGAFLSDTDDTNITDTNIIDNGDFGSNFTNWTIGGDITPTISSGGAKLNTAAAIDGYIWQSTSGEAVDGKWIISWTLTANTSGFVGLVINGTQPANGSSYSTGGTLIKDGITASGSHYYDGTITAVEFRHRGGGGGHAIIDNITFKRVDEDRSTNNKGLQVFGTVTKSAVATGADLVAYSGNGTSNYLEQPYNSDLNFGANSEFSVMGWMYNTSVGGGQYIFDRSVTYGSSRDWQLWVAADLKYINMYIAGAQAVTSGNNAFPNNKWFQFVVLRTGNRAKIYINGVEKANTASTLSTIPASNVPMKVLFNCNPNTKLSLFRMSSSVPSAEQIKKMYEDEKVLFQENAKATLYGSSDVVTGLAYDEATEQLHVGTSSGRSDFQGLRRINNTTTAVTTAISAHDGFIVEQ